MGATHDVDSAVTTGTPVGARRELNNVMNGTASEVIRADPATQPSCRHPIAAGADRRDGTRACAPHADDPVPQVRQFGA